MLKNAPLIVKIGVDTDENEPRKEWCVVADHGGFHAVPRSREGPFGQRPLQRAEVHLDITTEDI